MFLLKISALPKELSDRHFCLGPQILSLNLDGIRIGLGVVGIPAEMGTIASHPTNLPSVKASPGGSVVHKMAFIKTKGQSK